jgi:hypothetical protein
MSASAFAAFSDVLMPKYVRKTYQIVICVPEILKYPFRH